MEVIVVAIRCQRVVLIVGTMSMRKCWFLRLTTSFRCLELKWGLRHPSYHDSADITFRVKVADPSRIWYSYPVGIMVTVLTLVRSGSFYALTENWRIPIFKFIKVWFAMTATFPITYLLKVPILKTLEVRSEIILALNACWILAVSDWSCVTLVLAKHHDIFQAFVRLGKTIQCVFQEIKNGLRLLDNSGLGCGLKLASLWRKVLWQEW